VAHLPGRAAPGRRRCSPAARRRDGHADPAAAARGRRHAPRDPGGQASGGRGSGRVRWEGDGRGDGLSARELVPSVISTLPGRVRRGDSPVPRHRPVARERGSRALRGDRDGAASDRRGASLAASGRSGTGRRSRRCCGPEASSGKFSPPVWYLLRTPSIPRQEGSRKWHASTSITSAESRVPFPGDRAPGPGLRRGEPVREGHPPRDRRRHASAAARRPVGVPRRRLRARRREDLHGVRPEQGYGFLIDTLIEKAYAPLGVSSPTERDLHLRRLQVRHGEHPRHLRPRQQGGDRRPGLPGLQRHERDDRPLGPADERGYYEGIVYLPCTEANGFFPDVRRGRSTSSTCAPRTTRRARSRRRRSSKGGSTTPSPTTP